MERIKNVTSSIVRALVRTRKHVKTKKYKSHASESIITPSLMAVPMDSTGAGTVTSSSPQVVRLYAPKPTTTLAYSTPINTGEMVSSLQTNLSSTLITTPTMVYMNLTGSVMNETGGIIISNANITSLEIDGSNCAFEIVAAATPQNLFLTLPASPPTLVLDNLSILGFSNGAISGAGVIDGDGVVTLAGNSSSAIVTPNTLTINAKMVFRGNSTSTSGNGGAIQCTGTNKNVNIRKSGTIFDSNSCRNNGTSSTVRGGAIYYKQGDVYLDGDEIVFRHNVANSSSTDPAFGGAIGNNYGSVIISGTGTIFDSNLCGSFGTANGGAIRCQGLFNTNSGSVTITGAGTLFTNNKSTSQGGAIWCSNSVIISSACTFRSNSAMIGGAIYSAGLIDLTDVVFDGNNAQAGGAIYRGVSNQEDLRYKVTDVNVPIVLATGANGERNDIACESGSTTFRKLGPGTLILNTVNENWVGSTSVEEGSLIIGNVSSSAAKWGPPVNNTSIITIATDAALGGNGTIYAVDLSFASKSTWILYPTASGKGLQLSGQLNLASDMTFDFSNLPTDISPYPYTLASASGGIYVDGSQVAYSYQWYVYVGKYCITVVPGNPTLIKVTRESSPVLHMNTDRTLTSGATPSVVWSNSTTKPGRYFVAQDITVPYGPITTMISGSANIDTADFTLDSGDVVRTLSKSPLANNTVLMEVSGKVTKLTMWLNNITLKGFTKTSYGGGAIASNYIVLTGSGATFDSNNATSNVAVAGHNGGALWAEHNAIVTGVAFSNNFAKENGGALYSDKGSVDLTDVTFSNNTATGNGGAICTASNPEPDGGVAIYAVGNVTLTDVIFSGTNTAAHGGAVYISGSNKTLTYNVTSGKVNTVAIASNTNGFDCADTTSTFIKDGPGTLQIITSSALPDAARTINWSGNLTVKSGTMIIGNAVILSNINLIVIEENGVLEIMDKGVLTCVSMRILGTLRSVRTTNSTPAESGSVTVSGSLIVGATGVLDVYKLTQVGSLLVYGTWAPSASLITPLSEATNIFLADSMKFDMKNLLPAAGTFAVCENINFSKGELVDINLSRLGYAISYISAGNLQTFVNLAAGTVPVAVDAGAVVSEIGSASSIKDALSTYVNTVHLQLRLLKDVVNSTAVKIVSDSNNVWTLDGNYFKITQASVVSQAVQSSLMRVLHRASMSWNVKCVTMTNFSSVSVIECGEDTDVSIVGDASVNLQGNSAGVIRSSKSTLSPSSRLTITGGIRFNSNGSPQGDNGGAISLSGNLTMTDTQFTSNQAAFGGAVYVAGNLTMTNTRFTDNRSSSSAGNGGAVYVAGNVTMTDTQFAINISTSCGGAVYIASPSGSTTVSPTLVYNISPGNQVILSGAGQSGYNDIACQSQDAIFVKGMMGDLVLDNTINTQWIGSTIVREGTLAIGTPSSATVTSWGNSVTPNDLTVCSGATLAIGGAGTTYFRKATFEANSTLFLSSTTATFSARTLVLDAGMHIDTSAFSVRSAVHPAVVQVLVENVSVIENEAIVLAVLNAKVSPWWSLFFSQEQSKLYLVSCADQVVMYNTVDHSTYSRPSLYEAYHITAASLSNPLIFFILRDVTDEQGVALSSTSTNNIEINGGTGCSFRVRSGITTMLSTYNDTREYRRTLKNVNVCASNQNEGQFLACLGSGKQTLTVQGNVVVENFVSAVTSTDGELVIEGPLRVINCAYGISYDKSGLTLTDVEFTSNTTMAIGFNGGQCVYNVSADKTIVLDDSTGGINPTVDSAIFAKDGAGTLVLNTTNKCICITEVRGGAFVVGDSLANIAAKWKGYVGLTVHEGATISGYGTIYAKSATFNSGSTWRIVPVTGDSGLQLNGALNLDQHMRLDVSGLTVNAVVHPTNKWAYPIATGFTKPTDDVNAVLGELNTQLAPHGWKLYVTSMDGATDKYRLWIVRQGSKVVMAINAGTSAYAGGTLGSLWGGRITSSSFDNPTFFLCTDEVQQEPGIILGTESTYVEITGGSNVCTIKATTATTLINASSRTAATSLALMLTNVTLSTFAGFFKCSSTGITSAFTILARGATIIEAMRKGINITTSNSVSIVGPIAFQNISDVAVLTDCQKLTLTDVQFVNNGHAIQSTSSMTNNAIVYNVSSIDTTITLNAGNSTNLNDIVCTDTSSTFTKGGYGKLILNTRNDNWIGSTTTISGGSFLLEDDMATWGSVTNPTSITVKSGAFLGGRGTFNVSGVTFTDSSNWLLYPTVSPGHGLNFLSGTLTGIDTTSKVNVAPTLDSTRISKVAVAQFSPSSSTPTVTSESFSGWKFSMDTTTNILYVISDPVVFLYANKGDAKAVKSGMTINAVLGGYKGSTSPYVLLTADVTETQETDMYETTITNLEIDGGGNNIIVSANGCLSFPQKFDTVVGLSKIITLSNIHTIKCTGDFVTVVNDHGQSYLILMFQSSMTLNGVCSLVNVTGTNPCTVTCNVDDGKTVTFSGDATDAFKGSKCDLVKDGEGTLVINVGNSSNLHSVTVGVGTLIVGKDGASNFAGFTSLGGLPPKVSFLVKRGASFGGTGTITTNSATFDSGSTWLLYPTTDGHGIQISPDDLSLATDVTFLADPLFVVAEAGYPIAQGYKTSRSASVTSLNAQLSTHGLNLKENSFGVGSFELLAFRTSMPSILRFIAPGGSAVTRDGQGLIVWFGPKPSGGSNFFGSGPSPIVLNNRRYDCDPNPLSPTTASELGPGPWTGYVTINPSDYPNGIAWQLWRHPYDQGRRAGSGTPITYTVTQGLWLAQGVLEHSSLIGLKELAYNIRLYQK